MPFRGDYWVLAPEARQLVNGLLYPVPDPAFPFLGVHFTTRLDGSVLLGPNAVLALARDGYRRRDVRLRDALGRRLGAGVPPARPPPLAHGAGEVARDWSRRLLAAKRAGSCPSLRASDLRPAPRGFARRRSTPDGALVDDFVFDGDDRIVHVRNAPSPGATSSLAIGDEIAARVPARLGLTRSAAVLPRLGHRHAVGERGMAVEQEVHAGAAGRDRRASCGRDRGTRRAPPGSRVDCSAFQSASASMRRVIQLVTGSASSWRTTSTSSESGTASG